MRIYTKRKGKTLKLTFYSDSIYFKLGCPPDLNDPLILTAGRNGCTIRSAVEQIHRDLLKDFAYCTVWGKSAKFMPQKVGLNHPLVDEDVMQIYKKANISTKELKSTALVEKKNVKKEAKDMKDKKDKDKKK